MPDEIKRIDYYYVTVPDKPGEGARILSALQNAGVNLIGISAFPYARRSQVDCIPENDRTFMEAAKAAGLKISKKKTGFLIQGEDRPGALADVVNKLADAKINVTSAQAFSSGSGRYGGMLWVKTPDLRKASKALGIA